MPQTGSDSPLVSTFADDPEMLELIELFVDELVDRVEQIRSAWASSDFASAQRAIHQLKGSAGGHGFSPISEKAGEIEDAMRAAGDPSSVAEGLTARVDELASLCRRASAKSG